MKKIFTSIAFILFSTILFAQQPDTLKPVKGDIGLSLGISGLINNVAVQSLGDPKGNFMLFGRYYIKNDMALRLGLALDYDNQNFFSEDSVNIASGNRALQKIDSTVSQLTYTINIGLEKHLGSSKRLDPYILGDLLIGRVGSVNTDFNTEITDVTGTYKEQVISREDGGHYFGLGIGAGFNFFFSKKLSLGVEFGYAFTYTKVGGDYSYSQVITPVSGSQVSTFESGKRGVTQKKIGASPSSGLMLSFFF
ncbi:MAG: outer membrane beta-barrel protein [Vicingus serpentipes]|nr:outer membrane beta-barrel protein [Vicingus serpentipes]